jgi:cyclic dehypoxanthinyl futalosine synthase
VKVFPEEFSIEEGIELYNRDVQTLGRMADGLRREACGDLVTFVIDRNINYTNVCVSRCRFCAFYRARDQEDAYVLSIEEIMEKIGEAVRLGATQILMQGGLNPDLPLEYYEEMLEETRKRFPSVQRHFFSPAEIQFMAKVSGNSLKETLERLVEAGLQSIPGGGAEILDDRVRKKVSPSKISWEEWKEVMVLAHEIGLPTTATMVFGLGEGPEERVRHILRIRKIQEETGGFTAFIPWSFQPGNTLLARREGIGKASGIEYLKVVALSRILLHGAVRNVQASHVTQGPNVAQVALFYGANDLGGTMIEENVVKATGANPQSLPPEGMVRLIKDTGRPAARRDTLYNILEEY